MIAHDAAAFYLAQPNRYSIVDVRKQFQGKLFIVEGKPYLVFSDESTLSIQKIVQAKFKPRNYNGQRT